jgi:hypothetical protein
MPVPLRDEVEAFQSSLTYSPQAVVVFPVVAGESGATAPQGRVLALAEGADDTVGDVETVGTTVMTVGEGEILGKVVVVVVVFVLCPTGSWKQPVKMPSFE